VWTGSRNFEDKYLRIARERIDRGIREVLPPHEDNLLKQMKHEYTLKKTEMIT